MIFERLSMKSAANNSPALNSRQILIYNKHMCITIPFDDLIKRPNSN